MSAEKGRCVADGDQVRVNYIGRFADGSIFDSSEGCLLYTSDAADDSVYV